MKDKFRFIKKVNNQDKSSQMNQGNQQINKNHYKIDIICRLTIIIKTDSLNGIKKINQT